MAGLGNIVSGSAHDPISPDAPWGPTTLAELFGWPDRVVNKIFEVETNRLAFNDAFGQGIAVRTYYSGWDSPVAALEFLYQALTEKVGCSDDCDKYKGLAVLHASDIAPGCQFALVNQSGPRRINGCVFGRLEDRLPTEIVDKITKIQANYSKLKNLTGKDIDTLLAAVNESADIFAALMARRRNIFNAKTFDWCMKHERNCRCCVTKSRSAPNALTLAVAGSVCVGWSSEGLRWGVLHPSFMTFLVFIIELLTLQPDLFLHECTKEFPFTLIEILLIELYSLTIFECICPTQLGWPMHRPRQYIIGHKRGSVVSVGTPDDFFACFGQRTKVDGSVFFVAPPDEVHAMTKELAERRGMATTGPNGEDLDHSDQLSYLTGCQQLRERDYDATKNASPDHASQQWFADLNHNVNSGGPMPGKIIPTLLTHPMLWSWGAQRLATAKELMMMQGMPTYPIPGVKYKCPFQDALKDMSGNQLTTMSGNAMTQIVVGALLGYTLATTRRMPLPRIHRGVGTDIGLDDDGSDKKKDREDADAHKASQLKDFMRGRVLKHKSIRRMTRVAPDASQVCPVADAAATSSEALGGEHFV